MNHFTPVSEWQSKPGKRNELRKLLEHPVMREAFATIRGISRPTVSGNITIESIAIQSARLAGKHDCLDNLEALTRKPEKPEIQQDAQYLGMTPEEIKRFTEEQNTQPDPDND